MFYAEWHLKGVNRIKHLMNRRGQFLLYPDFCKLYNINVNFLQFLGIINAVKSSRQQQSPTLIETPPPNCFTRLSEITAKKARSLIGELKFQRPSDEKRFSLLGIEKNEFQSIYTLPFQSIIETKLIAFQLKIIHYILPTNTFLLKFHIKENDKCPLCTETHTIEHLFVECPHAQAFWRLFAGWWRTLTQENACLNKISILYGKFNEIKRNFLLNHLIVIAKHYMYTCFLSDEKELLFSRFLTRVREKANIELQSTARQRFSIHTKWEPLAKWLKDGTK